MRRPVLAFLAVTAATALAVLSTREADAKAGFDSPYTMEQTFGTALRMVRVDRGYKITEKDPAAGYVLFEYTSTESGDRVVPGSIEMVPSGDSVKVVVQLPQMPRYHEQVLADALQKKLKTELGEPLVKAKPAPSASAAPSASSGS